MVNVYVRDTSGKVDIVSSLALSIEHIGFLLEKVSEDITKEMTKQQLDRAGHADTWPSTSPAPQGRISPRASIGCTSNGKDDGEFEVPLSAAAYVAVSELWSIASLRVAMLKMFRSSSEASTVVHPKKLHPNREFARLFSSYAKSKSSFEGFLLG
nr:PREDICTED: uncharacterized protein LOC108952814 [Musa acuminata subsp. malaccensis]